MPINSVRNPLRIPHEENAMNEICAETLSEEEEDVNCDAFRPG